MAITTERSTIVFDTAHTEPLEIPWPIAAATIIVKGELVGVETNGVTAGYLKPMSASTTLVCIGRANASYDNSTGPAGGNYGDLYGPPFNVALAGPPVATPNDGGPWGVPVQQGAFWWNNGANADAVAQANLPCVVFASDDQTVALTDDTATLSVAGLAVAVDPVNGVLVESSVAFATQYTQVLQLGGDFPVSVPNGGTGGVTHTAHGVLIGEGTSNIAATAAMTDGQVLVGQTGADPLPKTVTGDVTITAAGATAIGAKKVTPAQDAVAALGGFGNEFTATVVLADSAGGATTNVPVPQKCEVVDIMVVKNTTLSASASDLVQVKNHGSGTALTADLLLNVAASTIVRPATLVAAQTVIALADGIDLVQPAHVTNNGCTVILRCIARA